MMHILTFLYEDNMSIFPTCLVFHRAIKQKLVYSNPMIHAYIYVTANLILQIHGVPQGYKAEVGI